MIKSAAEILGGRPRPVDKPIGNKSHPGRAGRKPNQSHCDTCGKREHHAKGECKSCYRKGRTASKNKLRQAVDEVLDLCAESKDGKVEASVVEYILRKADQGREV